VSVLWEKGPPFLLPALVFVKAGKGKESLFIILSQLSAGQQLTILGEKDSNPHKQIQSLPCYHYTIPHFVNKYIFANWGCQA
jgi:hypothetical protein